MRNLHLQAFRVVDLPADGAPTSMALDSASGACWVVSGDTLVHLDAAGEVMWTASLADLAPLCGDGGPMSWRHAAFVADCDGLFLTATATAPGTASSAMVLIRDAAGVGGVAPDLAHGACVLGHIDGGVAAVAWSADESLVAVVSGEGKVMIFSPVGEWDVVAEGALPPLDPSQPVSAAWRPDGKHVAVSFTSPATAGAGAGHSHLRTLAVLSQDGSTHAMGRNEDGTTVAGLQAGCSVGWSADGALIAVAQDVPARARVQVAFFETNGLRHRELVLGLPAGTPVHWVGWNVDNEALAVVATVEGVHMLQVWHRDNYAWQRKAVEPLHAATQPPPVVRWHPERALTMLIGAAGSVRRFEWAWRYDVGADAACTVAAVDAGGQVRLSPLGLSKVPPPMAYATLALSGGAGSSAQVDEVAFAAPAIPPPPSRSDGTTLLAVTGFHGQLRLVGVSFAHPGATPVAAPAPAPAAPPPGWHVGAAGDVGHGWTGASGDRALLLDPAALALSLPCFSADDPDVQLPDAWEWSAAHRWLHPCWVSGEGPAGEAAYVAAVACDGRGGDALVVVRWPRTADRSVVGFALRGGAARKVTALSLAATSGGSRLAVVWGTTAGGVHGVAVDVSVPAVAALEPTPLAAPLESPPEPVARLLALAHPDVGAVAPAASVPPVRVIAQGVRTNRLYADGVLVSPAVSSWGWCSDHALLLVVTVGPIPTLVATHLLQLTRPVAAPASDVSTATAAAARLLERGARFVASVPGCDTVWLQAPRGNCEGIVPRVLTLASVRAALDSRPTPAWGVALELCRTHRVDMNVLHDHNPALFTHLSAVASLPAQAAASAMARAVGGPAVMRKTAGLAGTDRIDLLLSALEDGDVTAASAVGLAPSITPVGAGAATSATATATVAIKYPRPGHHAMPALPASPALDPDAWVLPSQLASHDAVLTAFLRAPAGLGKVNGACAAVRAACLLHAGIISHPSLAPPTAAAAAPGSWRHPVVLSVITSYARQVPADLEGLLRTVQHVAAAEAAAADLGAAAVTHALSADAALSHAILVSDCDVELLYTTAVGMYDLPLANTLAQRGQTDPREYLPFLARLAKLSAHQPSLTLAVDIHLARWRKTLAPLVALEVQPRDGGGPPAPLPIPLAAAAVRARWTEAAVVAAARSTWGEAVARALGIGDAVADGAHASDDPDAVLSACLRAPFAMALAIAARHGLQPDLLAILPAGAEWAAARRRLHVESIMRGLAAVAADPGTPKPSAGSALHEQAAAGGVDVSATPAAGWWAVCLPPGLTWQAVAALPLPPVLHAARALLNAVSPPAVDDAVVLLLARAVGDGAALAAEAFRLSPAAPACPLPIAALTVAAFPGSAVRARRWPRHFVDAMPAAAATPPPPSLSALAGAVAQTLLAAGRELTACGVQDADHVGARALQAGGALAAGWCGDVEEGVAAMCAGLAWWPAAEAAAQHARPDLIDTVVADSFTAAVRAAAASLASAADAVEEAVAALQACRQLRAAMRLDQLIGAAEFARRVMRAGGGEEGDGAAGAGAPADGDDGASMWSETGSVVSGWGGASEASFESAGSGRSGASRASGKFSHKPRSLMSTTLGNVTATLRMGEGSRTAKEHLAEEAATAAAYDSRRSAKEEKRSRRTTTRSKRVRPGSTSEEAELEAALVVLLPTPSSHIHAHLRHLVGQAAALGMQAHLAPLRPAVEALVAAVAAALASHPLPPKRLLDAEVASAVAARGVDPVAHAARDGVDSHGAAAGGDGAAVPPHESPDPVTVALAATDNAQALLAGLGM
jgi:hypothetical protein